MSTTYNSFEANWTYQAELDAVNDILAAIGESPVNTLEGDANVDVVNARRILTQVNRLEQARGWSFNIEEEYLLTPDAFSNLIIYMPNYLSVMGTGGTQYVNRGGYLYDRSAKTDRFTAPVSVTMIEMKTFDEMPEVFKRYIINKAAKRFNIQFFGDEAADTIITNELVDLERLIMEYELDFGQFNAFSDPFLGQVTQR